MQWKRQHQLLLATMVAAAAAVRVWGVAWALPYLNHPDEPENVAVIDTMIHDGTANPHVFNYPSFFFDLYGAAGVVRNLAGGGSAAVSVQNLGVAITGRDSSVLSLRLVTVVLGVALVVAAGWLAWRLARTRPIVFLVVGLTAFHPLLVRNARWVTPDTLSALAATLAVAASVRVAQRGTRGDYAIAGVLVGLAASSKYNAIVVGVAVLTAHLIRPERWRQADRLALAGGATCVAFLVTTPYAILDFSSFWDGVTYEIDHYGRGHAGAEGKVLSTNLRWLWNSTGLLLLPALAAMAFGARRRLLLVPASFVVVYLAVISVQQVRFERNLLPIVPTLTVLAVVGVAILWDLVVSRTHTLAGRRAAFVIGAAVLMAAAVWPIRLTVTDTARAGRDERANARSWIYEHVPSGGIVAVDSYTPWLDPERYELRVYPFVVSQVEALLDEDEAAAIVVSSTGSGRFSEDAQGVMEKLALLACEQEAFDATGPGGRNTIDVFLLTCTG